MRRVLQSSPSAFPVSTLNLSATQRITWLTRNVLRPIERLEDALLEQNRPHFVHWEDALFFKSVTSAPRDHEDLLSKLHELKNLARGIVAMLEVDLEMKVETTDEIRFSIVSGCIDDLRDFYPEFPLSRGNWDPELKRMIGTLPEFVRRVFLEITGHHEQLDGPIQHALKDM